MCLTQHGKRITCEFFVPHRHQRAVLNLYRGRITEIVSRSIAGDNDGGTPRLAVIGADAGLVTVGFTSMTITHQ